jgi:hypothetical protein
LFRRLGAGHFLARPAIAPATAAAAAAATAASAALSALTPIFAMLAAFGARRLRIARGTFFACGTLLAGRALGARGLLGTPFLARATAFAAARAIRALLAAACWAFAVVARTLALATGRALAIVPWALTVVSRAIATAAALAFAARLTLWFASAAARLVVARFVTAAGLFLPALRRVVQFLNDELHTHWAGAQAEQPLASLVDNLNLVDLVHLHSQLLQGLLDGFLARLRAGFNCLHRNFP